MSEMLGNHHLLVRNFKEAQIEYEKALLNNPSNDLIKKKLIICYVLLGKPEKSLELFITLLSTRKEIFDIPDPLLDERLCLDIIGEYENGLREVLDAEEYHIGRGILWFFCDLRVSMEHFRKAARLDFANHKMRRVLHLLQKYRRHRAADHKKTSAPLSD